MKAGKVVWGGRFAAGCEGGSRSRSLRSRRIGAAGPSGGAERAPLSLPLPAGPPSPHVRRAARIRGGGPFGVAPDPGSEREGRR